MPPSTVNWKQGESPTHNFNLQIFLRRWWVTHVPWRLQVYLSDVPRWMGRVFIFIFLIHFIFLTLSFFKIVIKKYNFSFDLLCFYLFISLWNILKEFLYIFGAGGVLKLNLFSGLLVILCGQRKDGNLYMLLCSIWIVLFHLSKQTNKLNCKQF